jgi:hypothetical protein
MMPTGSTWAPDTRLSTNSRPAPEPQPTDNGHRRSEFDQQCDANLHVADRVEVRELASGGGE